MAENKALRGETMAERERFDSSPGSQENQGVQQNDVAQFVAQREALPLTPVWYQNLCGYIQGTFPADEAWKAIFLEQLATLASPPVDRALTALRLIRDTFVKDEGQGYRSRDRQFAIEIAGAALPLSPAPGQPPPAVFPIYSDSERAAIAAEGPGPVIPMPGPNATLTNALRTAVGHIEHMAAWIGKRNAGYSFESLGEDMPTIREALESQSPAGEKIRTAQGGAMEDSPSTGQPPVGEASPTQGLLEQPITLLLADSGKPEWQQIIELFARCDQEAPFPRLRDELVVMLVWARYGARAAAAAPALIKALKAATHALRSYQYGNSATDLALSVADTCEDALKSVGEAP